MSGFEGRTALITGGGTGLTYILYGGIIVVISRFEPGGLHEMWYRIAPMFRRRKDVA